MMMVGPADNADSIRSFFAEILEVMKKRGMVLCGWLLATFVGGQCAMGQTTEGGERPSWQEVWQSMTDIEDYADDDNELSRYEDDYETLNQLAEHPIDLNSVTREDLEQLPFLSELQVLDIMEYVDRYKPVRSLAELKMIRSLDYRQQALLPYFLTVSDKPDEAPSFPSAKTIARYGRHTLTATGRIPFYERKGDNEGYLGQPCRHSLRYDFTYGNYVRFGLVGAQDAGEPFFADRNGWGYDAYSYYFQIRKLGILDNAIVGKYKVSAGMGLILGSSFSLGKLAILSSMGRSANALRVHASRSEADYFQGAAATVRLAKPLTVTAFASYRPVDATLNRDGTVSSFSNGGYHRTQSEMDKKYNTHQTAFGGSVTFRQGAFRVAANAVYTHLDRSLEPNRQILYRRYYAHGDDFFNTSLDYGYVHHLFSFSGETAVNQDGALATINSLTVRPSSGLSLVGLHRFYSRRYTGLYAHSFSSGSRTQNESGLYLGMQWNPVARLHLQAYADYAYMPWPCYLISEQSHAWDFLLQGDYQWRKWTFLGRVRARLRQRDNAENTALQANNDYHGRLSANYALSKAWSLKSQLDLSQTIFRQTDRGWMFCESVNYHREHLTVSLLAGYFDTDTYASRIYIYEQQVPHEFAFPSFFGNGVRLNLVGKYDVSDHLRLSAKLGYTDYFDRGVIGSGLQQIDASHTTDLDLQLRWRF